MFNIFPSTSFCRMAEAVDPDVVRPQNGVPIEFRYEGPPLVNQVFRDQRLGRVHRNVVHQEIREREQDARDRQGGRRRKYRLEWQFRRDMRRWLRLDPNDEHEAVCHVCVMFYEGLNRGGPRPPRHFATHFTTIQRHAESQAHVDAMAIYELEEGLDRSIRFWLLNSHRKVYREKHVAYSVGYYLHYAYDENRCKYDFKRGKRCVDWFAQQLQTIAHQVEHELKNPIPLVMSEEDEEAFQNSTHCHICRQPFDREKDGDNRPV
ncbi:hypothetical protein QAD02_002486 [Eretmocerus hayati]|uniref:Uncharacterized protein n=1 Tax=Eretmocerus hayati TaxID=131215 RepID=A0ACC2NJF7_9HYME|nr:hypothetical protein QAD02_002486 [Eretmocerus hayati]